MLRRFFCLYAIAVTQKSRCGFFVFIRLTFRIVLNIAEIFL